MLNQKLQEMYLKRNSKIIIVKEAPDEKSLQYATALLANLNANGFTLSKTAYDALSKMPSSDILSFNNQIMPTIKAMIGNDKEYRSFYPNFPQDIMSKSEAELWFNQIMHYVGTYFCFDQDLEAEVYLPNGEELENLAFKEAHPMKEIDLGNEKDFHKTMQRLMESNVSLPEYEKDNLKIYFREMKYGLNNKLPDTIPNKENLASISKLIIETQKNASDILNKYYKTPTDVLRFATALSEGDVSLATNTKFRKFNNSEKRLIMGLLEKCGNNHEDFAKNAERFKVLLQPMHVQAQKRNDKQIYPKLSKTMNMIIENEKIEKYLGKVQKSLDNRDVNKTIELLSQRPGIFAEKLNECIRAFNLDTDKVLDAFEKVSKDISIPVLLRVKTAFEKNMNDKDFRVFKPKGKPIFCEENTRENLSQEVLDRVSNICRNAMIKNFKEKETLGKVYVDPKLEGYAVPTVMRDKSEGTKFIAEGSKIPAQNDKNFIRMGIWWTNTYRDKNKVKEREEDDEYITYHDGDYIKESNNESRVDLDMSVTFYKKDFSIAAEAAYYSSHKESFYTRSGDITNGGPVDGQGVAEFIDIDKKAMKEAGVAYAIVSVNNFSHNSTFKDMENSSFLIQEREDQFIGKEYEPMATEQKIELNGDCMFTTPAIYDVENDKFIWVDRQIQNALNNHHALSGITAQLYDLTQIERPQLKELIEMHVEARGELVENPEEADVVFTLERGEIPENIKVITPYESEIFISEYLDNKYREENIPDRLKEPEINEIEVDEDFNNLLNEVEESIKENTPKDNINNIFNKIER